MGWELRNGRLYYYRKRRIGGQVRSVYAGGGEFGAFCRILDLDDRAEVEAARAEWEEERRALDAEGRAIAAAIRDVARAVSRSLEAAGFHRPSRKLVWMRNRGPRSKGVVMNHVEVPARRSAAPGRCVRDLVREARDTIELAATVGMTAGGIALGLMDEFRELAGRHPGRVAAAAEAMGVDRATAALELIVDKVASSGDGWDRLADRFAPGRDSGITARSSEVVREVIVAEVRAFRADLVGPDPSPAEWHLAGAAALAWLDYHRCVADVETLPDETPLARAAYFDGRADRAHRRYVRTLKALAAVRKLGRAAAPIQIVAGVANIAQQRVNGDRPVAASRAEPDARLSVIHAETN